MLMKHQNSKDKCTSKLQEFLKENTLVFVDWIFDLFKRDENGREISDGNGNPEDDLPKIGQKAKKIHVGFKVT